jgi:hypothetical protein
MKISDIITPVSTKYGAPMGRPNIGKEPITITSGRNNRIVKKNQTKVYQKHVRLNEGYDIGGAYWGIGAPLYVRFTKDLTFVQFFRINDFITN